MTYNDGVVDGIQKTITLLQQNMKSFRDTWNECPEMKNTLQSRYNEHMLIIDQLLDMKKGLTFDAE